MMTALSRRAVAEFFGTMFLLAAIVGSGVMGQRLAGGNVAIALLANSIATGATLVALILVLGPISGSHLNPVVTLADACIGGIAWRETPAYIIAQFTGAFAGVAVAHLMFGLPLFSASSHARTGMGQVFSEFVATFGLLIVIWGTIRSKPSAVPIAVGTYITAAYWFTASTSFANPAVTVARSMTNTFAGIYPRDTTLFMAAQLFAMIAALLFFKWFAKDTQQHHADGA
jgi:glycerol uptake facilitator-like aquaporin